MGAHQEDARSKKVVFVAHCLLNTNAKVKELARYPGMCKEVVDVLHKYGLGIVQLPCPETLYLGVQRWWCTKYLYDNPGFRQYCRSLAKQFSDYLENYQQIGYEVVAVLGCDGSPTCGVSLTSYSEDWGGSPKDLKYEEALCDGSGVWMEELQKDFAARGLKIPPFYGLALDQIEKPLEEIFAEFEDFLYKTMNG